MLDHDSRSEAITPEEAWRRIDAEIPSFANLPRLATPRRAALGRILGTDLTATVDVPAADVSAMDGVAFAGDRAAGSRLTLAGTVRAGDPPDRGVIEPDSSCGWKIMTGAPIPRGADRVVPVEQIRESGVGTIELLRSVERGAHIRRCGEVVRTGAPLLSSGTPMTPGALSLLATHGYSEIELIRSPAVSILTTGDEVVAPDQLPRAGQLRDSHTDFLLAASRSLGIEARALGIAPDRRDALRAEIEKGLGADILLLCGGVSAGEFDFVEEVLAELGCRARFDAVAIQPGKPLVFALGPESPQKRPTLIFGLPGNPASVMVSFWLFVRPTLRRWLGSEDGFWRGVLPGTLASPLPAAPSRDRILPAEVEFGADGLLVHPLGVKGSHDVAAFARGTALVRVRVGAKAAPVGEICEILPLVDWRGITRVSSPR